MRLRRRQERKRRRQGATSAHRAPSPVTTPQAQHYLDVQNMSAITKAGRYETIRMMKYDGEISYDRVVLPPSYLISLRLPIEASSCQGKYRAARRFFAMVGRSHHGFMISMPSAGGADRAILTLAREPTWITIWIAVPRPTSPTANQYGAYRPTCSAR